MITNIVFDLGDVLISGDFTKSLTEDTRIPNEYIEDLEKCWILDHTSFTENCTRAEYLKKVNERTPMYLRKYIPIVCEISVSYLEVMNHTLSLINSLRERGYNIYYLSNWSKWHVQELKIANKFEFLKLMDGGVFSYETGYMKPDRRIYKYFLDKYNLDPSTCIFFDDKEENVKAARNVGMKAEVFYKYKGDELLAEFILNESSRSQYTFKNIKTTNDLNKFNNYSKQLLNSNGNYKLSDIRERGIKSIYSNNELIGYIGLKEVYNHKYNENYLTINSFIVLPEYQRSGHGANIINYIVDINKDKYNEISCMVDKDNTDAINFYNNIGKVNTDKLFQNNLYYVNLYFKKSVEESTFKRSELPDEVFGIPQERKYPMPDEKHTRSAIKLFNHVEPKYEKQLAKKVISNMKKYNIPYSVVGDNNRLKKYLPKTTKEEFNMFDFMLGATGMKPVWENAYDEWLEENMDASDDEKKEKKKELEEDFLNRKSKPVKNQKQHQKYLADKIHNNKTNGATDQSELPTFNNYGE